MKKRVVACILAVACIASLNGCGSKFNGQDTVVEVGDEKVTADVANFFARYQQAQFETTYSSYLIQSWILWKKCIFWMSTRMIIKFR